MKYIFGPVNSRRLGQSLGIDLLPFKTCSLDCVYCECGWTTTQTLERREWVPTAEVIAELDEVLGARPALDYVTFSGSGEPTLHNGIGRIIAHIKTHYPQYRVAVLSNATLLGDPGVQADLRHADLVVPSLDAATQSAFDAICRPTPDMAVEDIIEGIAGFRRGFAGLLLLEIFIITGINDKPAELAALREAALRIAPDAVQLNHLDRPAAAPTLVIDPDAERLEAIRSYFAPLQVQVVRSRRPDEAAPWDSSAIFREVLAALGDGPGTLSRLAVATGIREGDLAKTLARMAEQGLVHVGTADGTIRRI